VSAPVTFNSLAVLVARLDLLMARRSSTSGPTLTVMVTGSRTYNDRDRIYKIMDTVRGTVGIPIDVYAGGAAGADALFARWARDRNMHVTPFPAKWRLEGRKAGPLRNQRMVDAGPEFFVAVGMKIASGTEDCVKRAFRARIPGWIDGPNTIKFPTVQIGGRLLRTHGIDECEPPCSIHWPSRHHMADWPQVWRSAMDFGDWRDLMERICPHGCGHPDPDHIAFIRNKLGDDHARMESLHGCDGCCTGQEWEET